MRRLYDRIQDVRNQTRVLLVNVLTATFDRAFYVESMKCFNDGRVLFSAFVVTVEMSQSRSTVAGTNQVVLDYELFPSRNWLAMRPEAELLLNFVEYIKNKKSEWKRDEKIAQRDGTKLPEKRDLMVIALELLNLRRSRDGVINVERRSVSTFTQDLGPGLNNCTILGKHHKEDPERRVHMITFKNPKTGSPIVVLKLFVVAYLSAIGEQLHHRGAAVGQARSIVQFVRHFEDSDRDMRRSSISSKIEAQVARESKIDRKLAGLGILRGESKKKKKKVEKPIFSQESIPILPDQLSSESTETHESESSLDSIWEEMRYKGEDRRPPQVANRTILAIDPASIFNYQWAPPEDGEKIAQERGLCPSETTKARLKALGLRTWHHQQFRMNARHTDVAVMSAESIIRNRLLAARDGQLLPGHWTWRFNAAFKEAVSAAIGSGMPPCLDSVLIATEYTCEFLGIRSLFKASGIRFAKLVITELLNPLVMSTVGPDEGPCSVESSMSRSLFKKINSSSAQWADVKDVKLFKCDEVFLWHEGLMGIVILGDSDHSTAVAEEEYRREVAGLEWTNRALGCLEMHRTAKTGIPDCDAAVDLGSGHRMALQLVTLIRVGPLSMLVFPHDAVREAARSLTSQEKYRMLPYLNLSDKDNRVSFNARQVLVEGKVQMSLMLGGRIVLGAHLWPTTLSRSKPSLESLTSKNIDEDITSDVVYKKYCVLTNRLRVLRGENLLSPSTIKSIKVPYPLTIASLIGDAIFNKRTPLEVSSPVSMKSSHRIALEMETLPVSAPLSRGGLVSFLEARGLAPLSPPALASGELREILARSSVDHLNQLLVMEAIAVSVSSLVRELSQTVLAQAAAPFEVLSELSNKSISSDFTPELPLTKYWSDKLMLGSDGIITRIQRNVFLVMLSDTRGSFFEELLVPRICDIFNLSDEWVVRRYYETAMKTPGGVGCFYEALCHHLGFAKPITVEDCNNRHYHLAGELRQLFDKSVILAWLPSEVDDWSNLTECWSPAALMLSSPMGLCMIKTGSAYRKRDLYSNNLGCDICQSSSVGCLSCLAPSFIALEVGCRILLAQSSSVSFLTEAVLVNSGAVPPRVAWEKIAPYYCRESEQAYRRIQSLNLRLVSLCLSSHDIKTANWILSQPESRPAMSVFPSELNILGDFEGSIHYKFMRLLLWVHSLCEELNRAERSRVNVENYKAVGMTTAVEPIIRETCFDVIRVLEDYGAGDHPIIFYVMGLYKRVIIKTKRLRGKSATSTAKPVADAFETLVRSGTYTEPETIAECQLRFLAEVLYKNNVTKAWSNLIFLETKFAICHQEATACLADLEETKDPQGAVDRLAAALRAIDEVVCGILRLGDGMPAFFLYLMTIDLIVNIPKSTGLFVQFKKTCVVSLAAAYKSCHSIYGETSVLTSTLLFYHFVASEVDKTSSQTESLSDIVPLFRLLEITVRNKDKALRNFEYRGSQHSNLVHDLFDLPVIKKLRTVRKTLLERSSEDFTHLFSDEYHPGEVETANNVEWLRSTNVFVDVPDMRCCWPLSLRCLYPELPLISGFVLPLSTKEYVNLDLPFLSLTKISAMVCRRILLIHEDSIYSELGNIWDECLSQVDILKSKANQVGGKRSIKECDDEYIGEFGNGHLHISSGSDLVTITFDENSQPTEQLVIPNYVPVTPKILEYPFLNDDRRKVIAEFTQDMLLRPDEGPIDLFPRMIQNAKDELIRLRDELQRRTLLGSSTDEDENIFVNSNTKDVLQAVGITDEDMTSVSTIFALVRHLGEDLLRHP